MNNSFMVRALVALALTIASLPAFAARLGPSLETVLLDAAPETELEVIVTFHGDGPPTDEQLNLLSNLGLNGLALHELPIVGVVATPAEIDALLASSLVRSVWHNDPLEYDNDGGTELTGVDRLRTDPELRSSTGLPYSGKGVGLMINDSGIDGTHADLQYPEHVVQNVTAATNLAAHNSTANDLGLQGMVLPVTYTEDVANSDVGGGHGTHVAGIAGGTGARSGGLYEGVAPGADIIGYGSGAALFVLDALGGFDYALVNQFRYNIRIVSNSFGSPSEIGLPFDPDHPTSVATKKLADRGVVIVFSAGNSGSGEGTITGTFKKAPWVICVAAGNKAGNLSTFSSRGAITPTGGEVEINGETYVWQDRPTIMTPGEDIISVRNPTDPLAGTAGIDPAYEPFYSIKSGTSMAAPHAAGIVALMLEANPSLDWRDVKRIIQETATNVPGRGAWEVGAGYANAHAAVAEAAAAADFGATVNTLREFNANAPLELVQAETHDVTFTPVDSPLGNNDGVQFEVGNGPDIITAAADVGDNALFLTLISPSGESYGSGAGIVLLGTYIGVTAPAEPGTWTVQFRGVGGLTTAGGIDLDPLGLTNGYAAPTTRPVIVKQLRAGQISGLDDIDGHPLESLIVAGVANRIVDGLADGTFGPDLALTRIELAEYLTMGTGLRQWLPLDGSAGFADVTGSDQPFALAATAFGGALKDRAGVQESLMGATNGLFDPEAGVSRTELAFTLIQALGLEDQMTPVDGQVTREFDGSRYPVTDVDSLSPLEKAYVQAAIDLNLLRVEAVIVQDPFGFDPEISFLFHPDQDVSRAEYAVAGTQFVGIYRQSIE